MKETLMKEINKAFSRIEDVKLYACATLCDPRFKNIFFSGITGCASAINCIADRDGDNGFWEDLDQAVRMANLNSADDTQAGGMPLELRQYLNRPPVSRKENPDPPFA
ncbi:hypothetical protein FOCC_FOCC015487 [Frankliniella occidentalis]|nr:hypothetical protein FOCC_FOCC015487 [Frankliniella occidentalis]